VPVSSASARPEGARRLEQALAASQSALAAHLSHIAAASPRDVHQARVAARRLRSLLKTYAPLLGDRHRPYREDLRDTAGMLAEIRQIDVMARLEALRTPALAAALARRRLAAVRRLRSRLQARPVRVRRVAARRLAVDPAATDADLLRRVRRAWRRAAGLIAAAASAEARHELRIALKHCRYSLEIIDDVEPANTARLMRRLREVQQLLGDQRDHVLTVQWLSGARAPRSVPADERERAIARLARAERRLERGVRVALEQLEGAGTRWERAVTRLVSRSS
jgi:CHAD domain-containing protein